MSTKLFYFKRPNRQLLLQAIFQMVTVYTIYTYRRTLLAWNTTYAIQQYKTDPVCCINIVFSSVQNHFGSRGHTCPRMRPRARLTYIRSVRVCTCLCTQIYSRTSKACHRHRRACVRACVRASARVRVA